MTNVTAMPVAQGAAVPGVAVAATGKGGKSDLLFGDLLAVAVDGPVVQQPTASTAVPDELASLIAMFMPANPTPSMATVQQPAIAGSRTPVAAGSEPSMSKVGVAIDQADVLASLIQPATPGFTQATPMLGREAKPDSFRAMLAQLTPTAPGDTSAVPAPATSAASREVVPALRYQAMGLTEAPGMPEMQAILGPAGETETLKGADLSATGVVAQAVGGSSNSTTQQATAPEATARPAQEADRAHPADVKPVQSNAGQTPSEAFIVARQPAHDAGETRPLDTTQQILTAATTADRSVERLVSGAIQVDSRPAGDNGASTQDNARSAASLLTPAQPFHQAMAEATATRSPEATRMDADPSRRVIDQVVREVSVHRLAGRTDMVVKLNPPDLGTLRLHLVQDAGGMTSHIQTTNEQVRGLLQAHLPALVDALSGVGVRLNSVSITSDPSFGALMHNSAQGGNQQQPDVPRRQFAGLPGDTVGIVSSTGLYDAPSDGAGYSWLA